MKNELERIRKEDVVVEFETLHQGCPKHSSCKVPVKISVKYSGSSSEYTAEGGRSTIWKVL